MTDGESALEPRLRELMTAFDAAFAHPERPPVPERRGYLGIRLGGVAYALELEEIASLRKHVPVTPLPSEDARLLGVAGFGGVLTAVYELAGLLGQASGSEPVWCVLVRGAPMAFAFDTLEGQLRAEASEGVADGETAGEATADVHFRPGLDRPVVRLSALVARLGGVDSSRTEGASG